MHYNVYYCKKESSVLYYCKKESKVYQSEFFQIFYFFIANFKARLLYVYIVARIICAMFSYTPLTVTIVTNHFTLLIIAQISYVLFCPTLTKGSNWQITQIWESDVFRLDLVYSIPSLEQKQSSCSKIFGIKGEVSPNNNVDWVNRKQFYKPRQLKVWAELDNPFKRSDYAKLCMSPSLDGTLPEYVISQEDNSPLTNRFSHFFSSFSWLSIVILIKFIIHKCMHIHLSPNIPKREDTFCMKSKFFFFFLAKKKKKKKKKKKNRAQFH